jgi:phosphatidylserine/phosphatidylglycerophosphate/cardiolipin synthase-like enzyme
LGLAPGTTPIPRIAGKHYNVPVTVGTAPYTVTVHSKYFLMKGFIAGKAQQQLVYTGTQNWQISALRANDQNLLKVDDAAVFAAFEANFATLWSRAQCLTAAGAACP